MNILRELYKQAYAHNHNKCGIINKKFGIQDWVDLVFGEARLFCLRNKFPSIETWSDIDSEFGISKYRIFVNLGKQTICFEDNKENKVIIIGNTEADVVCDKLKAYHIILMHGAKVTIKATNRAVVFVENDGTGKVVEDLTNGAIVQYQ